MLDCALKPFPEPADRARAQFSRLDQGWAMGLESHGICVLGHESRDLGPGLGLILLVRLGLGLDQTGLQL